MSNPTIVQSIPVRAGAEVARRPAERVPSAHANGSARLANALGWFSIGLGLSEVLMPRRLGRAIGVGEHPAVLPLLGARELASGIAILASRDPAFAVRSRVLGDVIDLAFLGSALVNPRAQQTRVVAATAAVLGVTALDVLCSAQLGSRHDTAHARAGAGTVTKSVAINRPPEVLYGYWRELANLSRILHFVESVRETDSRRSHWIAKGPGDTRIEWDAEITRETPNELLAWQSLTEGVPRNQGRVEFKPLPAGRGTRVTLHLEYQLPRSARTTGLASMLGRAPEPLIASDLRRWKQLMETGEIATTEGQPAGKRSMLSRHLP
jgi:uncharacterized membrane protein